METFHSVAVGVPTWIQIEPYRDGNADDVEKESPLEIQIEPYRDGNPTSPLHRIHEMIQIEPYRDGNATNDLLLDLLGFKSNRIGMETTQIPLSTQ